MLQVKEFFAENRIPSNYEIQEAIDIAKEENCVVKLTWFINYNGYHYIYIKKDMTLEECVAKIPRRYGV